MYIINLLKLIKDLKINGLFLLEFFRERGDFVFGIWSMRFGLGYFVVLESKKVF